MTIKEKIKGIGAKILEYPKTSALALGLAGLITITAVKDNVHFGSTTLHNPQENHYTYGLMPTTIISEIKTGENNESIKGKFYTFGLFGGHNKIKKGVKTDAKLFAYGLIGGGNDIQDNSKVNNMSAYGLILCENFLGDNSKVNDVNAYGVFGYNAVGNNSKVNNMNAYGLIFGINNVGDNSEINGDVVSRGIIARTPFSVEFGSNSEIGLKNYIHKIEKKEMKEDLK